MRLFAVYFSTTLALLSIIANPLSNGQQPRPTNNSSLTVSVFDAFSGVPIAGAPVQVIGNPYIKITDQDGRVTFTPTPGVPGENVRVWTTPEGYAPGAAEVHYTQMNEITSIGVVPEDGYSTGLIDPAVGGTFVFTDTVHGWKDRQFYMEIVVPSGALSQQASITFSWYPTWAAFSNGIPEDRIQLGIIHLSLKNAQGDKISESLNSPITFKFRPYFTDGFKGIDTNDIVISRYNYDTHQFDTIGTPSRIDPVNELIEYDLAQFSIACSSSKPYSSPGKPIFSETKYCSEGGVEVHVTCGEYNEDGSIMIEKGTSATLSSNLRSTLEAEYKENIGIALQSIEMKCKVALSYEQGKSLTATTKETMVLSVKSGEKAWNKCYSGRCNLMSVHSQTEIKLPNGTIAGTIDHPFGVARKVIKFNFDSSCPGCELAPKATPPSSVCDDLPTQ